MTAQIHRQQAEVSREVGVELMIPAQRGLRETVEEDDRATIRIASFDDVELDAATTVDGVR